MYRHRGEDLSCLCCCGDPACRERRRRPMEKSCRSSEVKVRARMRALETWGKSKTTFSNTKITIKKGRTTKGREKCWQKEEGHSEGSVQ